MYDMAKDLECLLYIYIALECIQCTNRISDTGGLSTGVR